MCMKRAMDLVLSTLILMAAAPAIAFTAAAVFLRMGRPVVFRQLRPGLQGKPFPLYKFRTMSTTHGPDGRPLPDGARLTPLGRALRRWSLDELPQLWNVLKGDMSLVGPRPLLMEYVDRYTPEQRRRHDVRPGITGWAQVNGRNAISWEEKFAHDVWYVNNLSFWLDVRTLAATVWKVVRGTDVGWRGFDTMPIFMGSDASGRGSEGPSL